MPNVPKSPWRQPTAEQSGLLDQARRVWAETQAAQEAAQAKEDEAWKITQQLRDSGVPDLAICDQIEQVTKPTLNRRLGPRTPRP